MSWLSNIGKTIKKAAVDTGHFAGKVLSNPIVQAGSAFIPGVGPLITAGEGALGGILKPGGNLGQAARGGIQGAAAGALGGGIRKLGTGILTNGVGSTLKSAVLGGAIRPTGTFSGGSARPMSDANGIDGQGGGGGGAYGNIIDYDAGGNPVYASDIPSNIPQSIYDDPFGTGNGGSTGGSGGGGSWQDALMGGVRKLGSGIAGSVGGVGLGDVALGGLAGYQALNAANASKRAGQLSDKAIGLAESRWNAGAPLRTAGQARLLNPTRPDLSNVYTDATNPFAVRKLKAG